MLTGLYNRAHFDKRFIEEMDRAKRYKEPLSLIMIDADKFKDINDNYGHDIGDKALRNIANAINSGSLEVAKLLEKASRKSDICFRFGGDEFCIVLPNTNKEQANIVASRIQSSLSKEKIKLGEKTISINIRIGTETFYPDQMKNVTSDELFKAADKRMYEQKYKNK